MEEKKVLSIDTMICDLRTVSEETLQSYEKINISAMTVFVTERTQELSIAIRLIWMQWQLKN